MSLIGLIRTMDAKAVELAWPDVRKISVPHHVSVLGKGNGERFALARRRVEQTQLNA